MIIQLSGQVVPMEVIEQPEEGLAPDRGISNTKIHRSLKSIYQIYQAFSAVL